MMTKDHYRQRAESSWIYKGTYRNQHGKSGQISVDTKTSRRRKIIGKIVG